MNFLGSACPPRCCVSGRRRLRGDAGEASVADALLEAFGTRVRLEYDGPRTNRYDRTLAYVFLEDGTLANAEIIRQGYGFAYTEFPFKYLDEFRRLEREARENGRGLWGSHSNRPAARQPAPPTNPPSEAQAIVVYVTRTGDRYHRAGCRYLARSQIPMPLTEAAKRYTPCSVCRPPVP